MDLKNKTVIVTGGASGIGAALAKRFAADGARVVVADIDEAGALETAAACGGVGVCCDVTIEEQVNALVEFAREKFGPVDLFCSNAGVLGSEPAHAASASNDIWQRCWQLHVMAHVYAARAVLPDMIDRGEGYLLQIASAAGVLNQIGDAAYSATKHAAVGFAESLAITHGDDGVRVSVVCPQYVATAMLGYDSARETHGKPGLMMPSEVADIVAEGVRDETFLILPHPEVAQYMQFKSAEYDKWLAGMRKLRNKTLDDVGRADPHAMHKLV